MKTIRNCILERKGRPFSYHKGKKDLYLGQKKEQQKRIEKRGPTPTMKTKRIEKRGPSLS
jgi:hypothetical protein